MSRHERNLAYKEAINSGKTKEEAKSARESVKSRGSDFKEQKTQDRAPERTNGRNSENAWDFDSDINGNGTDWHTADDL